ncbi:MAG: hypothetical protein EOO36_06160 [Cytophagaceae bacterium]|nr:MAG: hypothetical protein EOO36_06160 [Cytophagaceae bacterium]
MLRWVDLNDSGTDHFLAVDNVSVSFTLASTTSPTLTATPTALSGFTYVAGSSTSPSQNFTLDGSNLTPGDLVATGSTNYEVSADNTTFGATAIIPNMAGGTLTSVPVYVRLKAGLAAGTYNNETISVTGGGTAAATNVTVSGSVTAPGPTLVVTPTSLSGFSTTVGTASAAQTYVLTGTSVTAATSVMAPAGYAVSANGTTFTSSITVAATVVNSAAGQTVYVRLTGATAGTPSGNITHTTTGATTVNVAVSGTVTPAPALTVSPTTLPAFNTLIGTPAAAQSYALGGSNLNADVVVAAPNGYEVSTTSATAGFASSQTVGRSGSSASATIYVRLTGAAAGTPSGSVTNTSAGATQRSVAVSGTVVGKPTGTPTISASSLNTNSVVLNLNAADGTNLLVVVRPAGSTATAPTDQTTYAASATYGAGAVLGAGRVVFAAANAASVTVTGLVASTSYVADVYTYNRGTATGFESYGATSGTTAFSTVAVPPALPGLLLFEDDFDYAAGEYLTAHGWLSSSANTTATIAGNATASNYPQGAALAGLPVGTSTQARLVRRSGNGIISCPATIPAGTTTLYAAAVLTVSDVENVSGDDYSFSFLTRGTISYRGQVRIAKVPGTASPERFTFGLRASSSATTAISSAEFLVGTTYVLVLKVENSAATSNQDVFSLYVLPATADLVQEPTSPLLTSTTGSSVFNTITAFAIRQSDANAPDAYLDGVRFATGWGNAVGNPVFTAATATINAGNYASLTLNNNSTLTPAGAVNVETQITLPSGTINTSAANSLTLYPAATVAAPTTSSPGYVNGPVLRPVPALGSSQSFVFPVGRSGNYRPLTLNVNQQENIVTYRAEQTEGDPGQAGTDPAATDGTTLTRVSRVRFFTLTPYTGGTVTQPTNFQGTVTLSFGADDQVTDPTARLRPGQH